MLAKANILSEGKVFLPWDVEAVSYVYVLFFLRFFFCRAQAAPTFFNTCTYYFFSGS